MHPGFHSEWTGAGPFADGSDLHWQVTGGFLEVLNNKVSVLAEAVEELEKKPSIL